VTRVAVTTAVGGSVVVAQALISEGLEPVLLPCIEVTPAPDHVLARLRRQASSADLILITSARAVTVTWPLGDMPSTPVAAVGPATARAVEAAGGVVAVTGPDGAAELVSRLDVAGKRVVFPHGRAADPATTVEMARRGAHLYRGAVYDTTPVAPGPDRVEAALFGSPLAVAGWCLSRQLGDLVVGGIGKTTADALHDRGVADPVVPHRPGFAALARALAERMER
jgi:uroporphyrinogen-III synthase